MTGTDGRLILLHERDNVFIAGASIDAGETIALEGARIALALGLRLGHKLSRHAIAPGEKILKYGVPIGSAIAAIPAGAHVHVHNVKSDYTPTHHLLDQQARHEGEPS